MWSDTSTDHFSGVGKSLWGVIDSGINRPKEQLLERDWCCLRREVGVVEEGVLKGLSFIEGESVLEGVEPLVESPSVDFSVSESSFFESTKFKSLLFSESYKVIEYKNNLI